MTFSPAVSIIVPCRDERDHIEQVLQSILSQEPPPGGFEVIVADGMSDDGTRIVLTELVNKNSLLRIIDNPDRIVSSGLNAAIRQAQGRIIIRMDAHTNYASNYVRQCVAVLNEREADNVGGPWVAEGNGLVGRTIAAAFQSPFAVGGAKGHDPNYEGVVDTVYLGCWPRQTFDRIGFFDEELVRNQDDEFNLRLSRTGGKIWQSPRIKSRYEPRSSLRWLFRQYTQYGYWKVRVIQKHKLPASGRHLVPGAFVFALIAFALGSFWWPSIRLCSLLLMGSYAAFNIAASFLTAIRNGWNLVLLLPVVFACFHFGYGLGFLRGIWDFLILQRTPDATFTQLTRSSKGAQDSTPA